MLSADLLDLYRHMSWADAEVWKSVHAFPVAKEDAKVRKLLLHIHTVQRAFLSIWTNAPLEFPSLESFTHIEEIQIWGMRYHADIGGFLTDVSDDQLDRLVHLPWAEHIAKRFGTVHPVKLRETMVQVTAHSTYHRGQVNMRLRELGGEPPLVDYIAWLWFGRPAVEI